MIRSNIYHAPDVRHSSPMQGGFTLIELMVVISIAAIMLGIGVPSFKDFIAGQRAKGASSAFATAAILARSEAIKRNTNVVLVAAGGGWVAGWSVKAGTIDVSKQEPLNGVVVTGTPSAATQITYQNTGRLVSGELQTLQFSGDADIHARCVSFDLSGMPKSRLGTC